MTTYATRSPLALLSNSHMMNDARKTGRRTSDRLREKEDIPLPNGIGHSTTKSREKATASEKQTKANGSETVATGKETRGKRKLDYEESDGFMFTRTRSKKAKAAAAAKEPAPVPETIQEEEIRPPPVKKTRKKQAAPDATASQKDEQHQQPEKRRRSARNSGGSVDPEPPPVQVKKRRTKGKEPSTPAPVPESRPETEPQEPQAAVSAEAPSIQNEEVTKVALPFADTPIIRRNQEMRANSGQRRSSLGNRGRRASSLIDSGKSNALPHEGVDTREYYKHIESGLPEPRRMRQLLTWCGTRALGEKPSFSAEDSHAKLAAREIQQQLLKDFSVKSDFSDWFSRRESTPPPRTPRPNPKNLSNLSLIADLEQKIARLQLERQTWEKLLQPTTEPLLPPFPETPQDPHTAISTSLLASPTQLAALSTLQSFHQPQSTSQPHPPPSSSTLLTSTSSRLQRLTSTLEFSVDKFASNVHTLDQYQRSADKLADGILAISADALEERERLGGEKERENAGMEEGEGEVGMRDVLRGLSRVVER
ncbi:MAG: hypothetical protein HETSPECPRED_000059 [Heterodermia speciosa]|uniref:Kinetochore protein Mis13 n=1 Tax=Heterodermia speciosa TaxID=116794 RepID=A0A8H3ED64_9LECA|nr:MAG: hypothetical protein HETSPECPRED_000059 [Heterodermia speciosa]